MRFLYNHFLKANNIRNWGHQQRSMAHAGQELPQAPVDVVADILANWGEMSTTTIKQEAIDI